MKVTKNNIKDITVEEAHGGSGSRQLLVKPEQLPGNNFEAMTKGFLEVGKVFDWHDHKDINEICFVIKGTGKFYYEDEVVDYEEGDIITIPANSSHRLEALGDITNEFYFIRFKA